MKLSLSWQDMKLPIVLILANISNAYVLLAGYIAWAYGRHKSENWQEEQSNQQVLPSFSQRYSIIMSDVHTNLIVGQQTISRKTWTFEQLKNNFFKQANHKGFNQLFSFDIVGGKEREPNRRILFEL